MIHSTTLEKLTLCSLLSVLYGAGTGAYAHTGVRDQAEEDKASYNGFTITHGCGGHTGTTSYPVIGQAALFPDGANAVWRSEDGAIIETGGNGLGTISSETLSLAVTGYAGLQSPFATAQEIVDSLGNVHGLLWKDGAMEPKLNAITPFKITAPTIADNCVKSLKVRIGVINYCDVGKNMETDAKGPYKTPKDAFGRKIPLTSIDGGTQTNVADSSVFKKRNKGNGDNNRADWWFTAPEGGSALYNDPDLLQPTYWTTLTINNSETDTANCAGTPVDVTVEPNGADFDAYLTERNTQPFTKGGGPL